MQVFKRLILPATVMTLLVHEAGVINEGNHKSPQASDEPAAAPNETKPKEGSPKPNLKKLPENPPALLPVPKRNSDLVSIHAGSPGTNDVPLDGELTAVKAAPELIPTPETGAELTQIFTKYKLDKPKTLLEDTQNLVEELQAYGLIEDTSELLKLEAKNPEELGASLTKATETFEELQTALTNKISQTGEQNEQSIDLVKRFLKLTTGHYIVVIYHEFGLEASMENQGAQEAINFARDLNTNITKALELGKISPANALRASQGDLPGDFIKGDFESINNYLEGLIDGSLNPTIREPGAATPKAKRVKAPPWWTPRHKEQPRVKPIERTVPIEINKDNGAVRTASSEEKDRLGRRLFELYLRLVR